MKVKIRFTIAPSCQGCRTEEGSEVWQVPMKDGILDYDALFKHIDEINHNFASVWDVQEITDEKNLLERYYEWRANHDKLHGKR